MSAVMVRTLAKEPAQRGSRTIERVRRQDLHTLVIKHGAAHLYLRFRGPITVEELIIYCEGQANWQVRQMAFTVDGVDYPADQARLVELTPATECVRLGQTLAPAVMEMRRQLGAKG